MYSVLIQLNSLKITSVKNRYINIAFFVVKFLNIADEEISEFCADLHSILDEMVEKQLVIMKLND